MIALEQADELNAFTDQLFGYDGKNALAPVGPRLDFSKPNFHDSKKEFLLEKNTLEQAIRHAQGLLDQFVGPRHHGDAEHSKMKERVRDALDGIAVQRARQAKIDDASDLALKNLLETGFFYNSLLATLEFISVYQKRLDELNDQERQFWNVTSRPPNYYARTIAVRFARMYARETKAKPTFGISREGNHPSTDYGRALEQVFIILNINAKVRNPAEWAIAQLTESDLNSPTNALRGDVLGLGTDQKHPAGAKTHMERIVEMLAKRADP